LYYRLNVLPVFVPLSKARYGRATRG